LKIPARALVSMGCGTGTAGAWVDEEEQVAASGEEDRSPVRDARDAEVSWDGVDDGERGTEEEGRGMEAPVDAAVDGDRGDDLSDGAGEAVRGDPWFAHGVLRGEAGGEGGRSAVVLRGSGRHGS